MDEKIHHIKKGTSPLDQYQNYSQSLLNESGVNNGPSQHIQQYHHQHSHTQDIRMMKENSGVSKISLV